MSEVEKDSKDETHALEMQSEKKGTQSNASIILCSSNANKCISEQELVTNKAKGKRKREIEAKERRTSKFVGVHWHRGARKWVAQISIGCRRMHLGYFNTEFDAALAYDQQAESLNRPLNFKVGSKEYGLKVRAEYSQVPRPYTTSIPASSITGSSHIDTVELVPPISANESNGNFDRHFVMSADGANAVAAILMGMASYDKSQFPTQIPTLLKPNNPSL